MKNRLYSRVAFAAVCFLLIGTFALAQSKPETQTAKPEHAAAGQSASIQHRSGHAKSLAVDHAGGNGVRRMDGGNSSGPRNTAGQQPASIQHQSGHAKSIAVDHAGGNGVRRMDRGSTGANPLYEAKDKTASKPAAGASTSPQYKDPEDMTTRYRPGNNKTTVKSPAKPKSGTSTQ